MLPTGAEEEEEEEEEEDQASPLKGSSDWQQQRSTAQHDSGESAGKGVMHMPQFAALSARARAAEALQREQQEQEEQRLRKQQQQQQQDEEQLQGVQGATQEPSAGAAEEGSKIEIKCQYKVMLGLGHYLRGKGVRLSQVERRTKKKLTLL
eukprot:597606-Pelagomonas_calceolata.AAC.1